MQSKDNALPAAPEPGPTGPAGPAAAAGQRPRRVAIVGVPGSGKSLLFERLSGRHRDSEGYPFTTDGLATAEARLAGDEVELIDTPGVTGLDFCSEHEAVTRGLLQTDPPDLIIHCVDADNLVRSLVLGAQLADLELPVVIALVMVDEALGRGQLVEPEALERELGVPAVPICSVDGRGINRLVEVIGQARPPRQVPYPRALQEKLDAQLPRRSRAAGISRVLDGSKGQLPGQSLWHMVHEAHEHWARETAARVTRQTGLAPRRSIWDRVGDAALHPIGAWVFLVGMVVAGYVLVSRVGVGLLATAMETHLSDPLLAAIGRWTGPGVLREVLVGPFGLLSLGLFNAVCTVLPILLVFHLLFSFLEEVGYFPLLSVQFDRLLRSFGLTGRAVLPISVGFGCNSVAILSARCLESPRQRFIACYLIALGVPCAVQLGVILAILSTVPVAALLGFVAVVIGVSLASGRLLALVLPRGERGEFLVELKRLRAPRWRSVGARTGRRLIDFFRELVPLFVAAAAVLQALHWTGILPWLRRVLAPVVVTALGLPSHMADVLLMALARREVAAVMMKGLVDRGALSLQQILVALTVMTLFVPCTNAVLVLGRVLGARRATLIFFAILATALVVGALMHLLWR
jgi:ferrous iron transport protein B